jgi:Uma2 family endonuclease
MAIARQRLSLETFLQLPEQKPALEYLDGVVTQKMSPEGPHGRLHVIFCVRFETYNRSHPGAWVFTELRTTYSGANASFVPDVAVYLKDRIPTKPSGEVADDFFDPPDTAIEIGSPGQTISQLLRRARWYVDHGARISLVADPHRRAIYTIRAGLESGPLRGADVVDLGDVLPGFSFVVGELFGEIDVR